MIPKEKAQQLVNSYKPLCRDVKHTEILDGLATVMNDEIMNLMCSKQCALTLVDEILWEIIKYADNSREYVVENAIYWKEVKKEINNL